MIVPRMIGNIKRLITDNTCAICWKTIQGKGGIYTTTKAFSRKAEGIQMFLSIILIER